MNFKFENKLDENLMLLTVSSELRKKLNQPHVTCGFKTASLLVKENYECPSSHTLGECLNPRQILDNDDPNGCSITWKFTLIPVNKVVKKKSVATSTKKARSKARKTTAKKSKND